MRPASSSRLPPIPAATWAVWIALGIPQAAAAQAEPAAAQATEVEPEPEAEPQAAPATAPVPEAPLVAPEVEPASEPAAAPEPEAPPGSEAVADTPADAAEDRGIADEGLELDARLYVLWRLTDESDDPTNEFLSNSMRVQAAWRPTEWVEAVLELEAEQLVQAGTADGLLRDAYVALTAFPWLEALAGQFKRPFSRIELLPRSRLTTIDRGLVNRWVVRRLGYGDRDVGVAFGGRLWDDARLDYAMGVFNGNGAGLLEGGADGFKDFSARLDARPVRWLSLGLSFSLDTLEDGDLPYLVDPAIFAGVDPVEYPDGYTEADFRAEHSWMVGTSWMSGADVVVRVAGLRLLVEAVFGENWWFEGRPLTAGVTLLASYEIDLSDEWGIRLEPVFRGELVIPRIAFPDVRMWRAVVGMNLKLGDYVRLMVDGEFTRVEGAEPDEVARDGLWPAEWPGGWEDTNCLLVQLALDV